MNKSLSREHPQAFTWCPNPSSFEGITLNEQLLLTKYILLDLITCTKFTLYPELTKRNNIHYHGIIFITDIESFNKVLQEIQSHGYTCMKPKPNMGWVKYCRKDLDKMNQLYPHVQLPMTETSLKNRTRVQTPINQRQILLP